VKPTVTPIPPPVPGPTSSNPDAATANQYHMATGSPGRGAGETITCVPKRER
jgi:hypothetical protein